MKNNKIIALLLAVIMVASTSVSFAGTVSAGEDGAEVKEYTVEYMFDLDDTVKETAKFYYSDAMLNDASTVFNEHLATASMGLALAAGGDDDGTIKGLLEEMGFEGFQSNYSKALSRTDNIAFSLANKASTAGNNILIPVVIRGSHYKSEWIDNFQAGKSGDAAGYKSAAEKVKQYVTEYIANNGIDSSKVKLWVIGYSRGAAVADLTSELLTSKYKAAKVYGYCFEGPMTNSGNGKKANIHHFRNAYDGVTCVLPEYMGFGIAGKVDANITNLKKEAEMLKMLQEVVPTVDVASQYESPSEFCWAKVDTSDILSLSSFPTKYVAAGSQTEFWNVVLKRIKTVIPSRDKYTSVYSSNVKTAASSLGVEAYTCEQSFMGIMEFIQGLSDSEISQLKDKVGSALLTSVMNTGLLNSPLLKMVDETKGNCSLTSDQYTKVVTAFADAFGKDAKMKASIAGGLDPVIKFLDADFADPNHQILGTVLFTGKNEKTGHTGSNVNKLIFPHGLETTMAWLMTEDSNFTSETKEASVTPAKATQKKAAAYKKAFTAKWSKVAGASGYEIQYGLKSSFSGAKTAKVTSGKTVSKKIKNLKAKKKYYVRVRAYKTRTRYGVKKTVYGAWSAKTSVKTK